MSIEQDILAGRINAAMEEWDALTPGECEAHMASHIAVALIAAGYRPRPHLPTRNDKDRRAA